MFNPHHLKRFNLFLALLLLTVFTSVQSAHAGGSFDTLTFPDASADSCGTGWKISGAYVAGVGEVMTWTATDGRGTKLMSGTYTAPNTGGTITSIQIQSSDVWKPRKNPIHIIMKSGDQAIADLKANIPCLPVPPPPPVKFDPAVVNIPQDPTDRLVVICRRNLFVISGVNDKSKKYALTTLDLNKVIAAGGAGLTKDLRREGKLTLLSTGGGNFTLQWIGGRWNADGQGGSGFAKSFTCAFK